MKFAFTKKIRFPRRARTIEAIMTGRDKRAFNKWLRDCHKYESKKYAIK